MTSHYACDDFATATDKPEPTAFQVECSRAADASGLPHNGQRQMFMQGYTHAMQDRHDLVRGAERAYLDGYATYRDSVMSTQRDREWNPGIFWA